MPAVNPMIGVLMVGERAADLIRDDRPGAPESTTSTTNTMSNTSTTTTNPTTTNPTTTTTAPGGVA
jgi:hypothetical protein